MPFYQTVFILLVGRGCVNMYLQGIEILSGFTANEFGIKVRYQPSGTKTKMGKEGLKLLLDVKSEVLERVDVYVILLYLSVKIRP